MQWWLAYLIAPVVAWGSVLVTTIFAPAVVTAIVVLLAGALLVIPVVLAAMIWSTVQLRHTQAATGLLYLGVVAVLFGEFFSKFLLFSVKLPL